MFRVDIATKHCFETGFNVYYFAYVCYSNIQRSFQSCFTLFPVICYFTNSQNSMTIYNSIVILGKYGQSTHVICLASHWH